MRAIDNPKVNDPIYNLAMNHVNSAIFQRNYLSRMIRYDIQATYRSTNSKIELIRVAERISRLINSRRPKKLTDEKKKIIRHKSAI